MGVKTSERKLEDLSDRDFRSLVERELRKDHQQTSPQEREYLYSVASKLRDQSVIGRWVTALETMKASAESQIGAKRDDLLKQHDPWVDSRGNEHPALTHEEYLAAKREFQDWRAKSVRFLNSVNQRLLEARELRRRYFCAEYPTRAIEERNLASEAYIRLLQAIEEHRQTVDIEYEPTDADRELWRAITTEEPGVTP